LSQSAPNPRYLLGFAALLGLVGYVRALSFGFVLDDNALIVGDARLRHLACVPALFRSNFFGGTSSTGDFYRPMANAWFALNYGVFGLHAWGWHLASILLHLAVILGLFALLARLLDDRTAAGVAAVLFAAMPIHAEPVIWLSCAGDELCALFLFVGLLAADLWLVEPRPTRRMVLWLTVCLTFAASLFSKESATLFPIVFAVLLWTRANQGNAVVRFKYLAAMLTPLLLLAAIFLAVRVRVLSHSTVRVASAHEFVLTLPRIAVFYLAKLVWPFYPAEFHDLTRDTAVTTSFWPALILTLIAIMAGLWLWMKSPKNRVPLALLVVPLVPAIAAVLFVVDLVHDRYLYLPSAGAAALGGLAFTSLLRRFPTRARALFLALGVLAVGMAVDLVLESAAWKDDWTLAKTSVRLAPRSSEANMYYANALDTLGEADLAAQHYQQALASDPKNSQALQQLGDIALRAHDPETARRDYERVVELLAERGTPNGIPYSRLALVAELEGKLPMAVRMLQRAVQIDPQAAVLHTKLAEVYAAMNRPDLAEQERKRADSIVPAAACR
jgi:tetratricopeptide (TPR) repeat protein